MTIYLIDRNLKKLFEVPLEDEDFTIRQFMYQLLVLRMGIEEYLQYGIWVSQENNNEEIPLLNLNRTVEQILQEYGITLSLIIKRRVLTLEYIKNIDKILPTLRELEVDLLFTQLHKDNLTLLSYNEEPMALKQAAICEVLVIM